MWYLLIICIICNVGLAVIFKSFPDYKVNTLNAIVVNYFVCVVVATVVLGRFPLDASSVHQPWFPYALFLAFTFIIGFNITALTYQHFGVAFTAIMQRMSLVFPVAYAILVYSEASGLLKIFGLILAMASIVLINLKSDDNLKIKSKWLWLLPFYTLLIAGLIETILIIVEKESIVESGDIGFVSAIFAIAGVLGFIFSLMRNYKQKISYQKQDFAAGLILGIPNFFTIYLLVVLLDMGIDGSLLFPLNNISVLILSAFAGILFYREKLNPTKIMGFIAALGAIIILGFMN